MARARAKGRPILGAVSGLFFGFFVSLALTVYAGVPLDSVLYIVLTVVGFAVGIALGITGPFRRRSNQAAVPGVPQPPPPRPAS